MDDQEFLQTSQLKFGLYSCIKDAKTIFVHPNAVQVVGCCDDLKKKTPKEPKDFSIQIHNGVHAYWVGRVGFKNIRRIMIYFYFQQLELYTCTTFLFQKHVKSVCIPNSIVYAKPSQNTDMSCLDNDTNIIILYMLLFIYRK